MFASLDEKVRGKHCDGIAGIIEEGKSSMEEDFDEATMDACLIAAGQRAEHYEMAAYGTLVAWAQAMGHTEAADLLQQTLDEEKAADEKLSPLAEGGINQEAAERRASRRRGRGGRRGRGHAGPARSRADAEGRRRRCRTRRDRSRSRRQIPRLGRRGQVGRRREEGRPSLTRGEAWTVELRSSWSAARRPAVRAGRRSRGVA